MSEGGNTRVGKHVAVFVKNVAVVFKEVKKRGNTIVKELEDGPVACANIPEDTKILQYYKIKTKDVEYDGPVKIRIVLPCRIAEGERELWKWHKETKIWKNITEKYNPDYHVIVSKELERLSIFGVT